MKMTELPGGDNPYASPQAEVPAEVSLEDQRRIEEAARRLVQERQDRSISIQIFVTGILGCLSPIVLIYGLIFLLRRPGPFPLKGLAIAGAVLHGVWSALLALAVAAGALG